MFSTDYIHSLLALLYHFGLVCPAPPAFIGKTRIQQRQQAVLQQLEWLTILIVNSTIVELLYTSFAYPYTIFSRGLSTPDRFLHTEPGPGRNMT